MMTFAGASKEDSHESKPVSRRRQPRASGAYWPALFPRGGMGGFPTAGQAGSGGHRGPDSPHLHDRAAPLPRRVLLGGRLGDPARPPPLAPRSATAGSPPAR